MKAVAAVLVVALSLASESLARDEADPPLVHNPRITIDYEEPRHPIYGHLIDPEDARATKEFSQNVEKYERFNGIRQRLIKRQLLEEFSQFLAPVRLPIMLRLVTMQCNTVNAFYNWAESKIILCYEFVADIENGAPKQTTSQGITREDAIIGGIVGVLLHEAGHAVSNLLRLPVLGREEDTADQIAAYVPLQFGRDVARTVIKGWAYSWQRRETLGARYWGTHSSALQRKQAAVCLAYGADPEGFEDFVVKYGWLPKARADNCANEYRQVQHAFRATILPHIDTDLMEKVRARKWLRPDDGKKQP